RPVTLEFVDVPLRTPAAVRHRRDGCPIFGLEAQSVNARVSRQVSRARGPDDSRSNLRQVEHGTSCHGGDVGAALARNARKVRQQLLEQSPASEVIDDQLVFGQGPVRKRGGGLWPAKPVLR